MKAKKEDSPLESLQACLHAEGIILPTCLFCPQTLSGPAAPHLNHQHQDSVPFWALPQLLGTGEKLGSLGPVAQPGSWLMSE